ncbi:hypothetical protein D9M71_658890 [compost metagenome]
MKARGILDDRHQSTAQLGFQFSQGGIGGQGLQFVGHGAGDGPAKVRNVFMHAQQDVGLVDHADQLLPLHQHRQLRDIRQAHALESRQ